jgi:hypothetical protein
VGGQHHVTPALPLEKVPDGTLCTAGWVGPGAQRGRFEEEKNLSPSPGSETRINHTAAQFLYRLSYSGYQLLMFSYTITNKTIAYCVGTTT